jgi:hypothetical protein
MTVNAIRERFEAIVYSYASVPLHEASPSSDAGEGIITLLWNVASAAVRHQNRHRYTEVSQLPHYGGLVYYR